MAWCSVKKSLYSIEQWGDYELCTILKRCWKRRSWCILRCCLNSCHEGVRIKKESFMWLRSNSRWWSSFLSLNFSMTCLLVLLSSNVDQSWPLSSNYVPPIRHEFQSWFFLWGGEEALSLPHLQVSILKLVVLTTCVLPFLLYEHIPPLSFPQCFLLHPHTHTHTHSFSDCTTSFRTRFQLFIVLHIWKKKIVCFLHST